MEEFIESYGFKSITTNKLNEQNLNNKNVKELTYRELQYICKKNKIRSNIRRSELEIIVADLRNNKKINRKYLSTKHPEYSNSIFSNFLSNATNYVKSLFT